MKTDSRTPDRCTVTVLISVVIALLAAACPAEAQLNTSLNYNFTVPFAKTAPNPCTSGFVLVNGSMNVAITTMLGSSFMLQVNFTSSGRGDDAAADGTLLSTGTPYYTYSSQVGSQAQFPDGKPSYFAGTLTVKDYLERLGTDGTNTGDSFIMKTALKVTFNNGVPTTPTVESIDVSCK